MRCGFFQPEVKDGKTGFGGLVTFLLVWAAVDIVWWGPAVCWYQLLLKIQLPEEDSAARRFGHRLLWGRSERVSDSSRNFRALQVTTALWDLLSMRTIERLRPGSSLPSGAKIT